MDSQRLVFPVLPAVCQFRTGNDYYGINAGYIRLQPADGIGRPDQALPVLTGKARHELMAYGKPILAQERRSVFYLRRRMPASGPFQYDIIHRLYAQFDRRHAIALQPLQDRSGNAVGTGRTADGIDAAILQCFISRFQQAFLQGAGNSRKTSTIKGGFPVTFFYTPGIGIDKISDFAGIGYSLMSRYPPLIAEYAPVGTTDMRNKNGDDRCTQSLFFHHDAPVLIKKMWPESHILLYTT